MASWPLCERFTSRFNRRSVLSHNVRGYVSVDKLGQGGSFYTAYEVTRLGNLLCLNGCRTQARDKFSAPGNLFNHAPYLQLFGNTLG